MTLGILFNVVHLENTELRFAPSFRQSSVRKHSAIRKAVTRSRLQVSVHCAATFPDKDAES